MRIAGFSVHELCDEQYEEFKISLRRITSSSKERRPTSTSNHRLPSFSVSACSWVTPFSCGRVGTLQLAY